MAGYYEKTPSGKYRLFASGGVGPNGKRKRHTKTISAKSDRQAEKALAKFVAEVEKSEYIEPSKFTFAEFVKRWFKNYGNSNLSPKTRFRYEEILNSRVIPAMGHLRVEQIKPFHLMEFYASLQEDGVRMDGKPGGLSPKTILQHHRILSSIFESAVQWQVISDNPARRVKPPKVPKAKIACYGEEQIKLLLDAASKEELKHQTLIYLALFTGLRRGEIMGLEWQHVDFDSGDLTVEQASQYLPSEGIFTKSTKNESSNRIIALPSVVLDLLRQHKTEQVKLQLLLGDLWKGSDRIFTTWDGGPGHPDWATSWFGKFIKRHGLPPLSFHGLRHTSVTMLINENVPIKNISGRLGHAATSTTLDIYAHFLKSADKDAADKLDLLYQDLKKTKKRYA